MALSCAALWSSERGLCDDPSSQASTKRAVRTGPLQAHNSERLPDQHIMPETRAIVLHLQSTLRVMALIYMYLFIISFKNPMNRNWTFVAFSTCLIALRFL